jgi:hypothetical protein
MIDLTRTNILPMLPDGFNPELGDRLPAGIVGSTILGFGTADPSSAGCEGVKNPSRHLVIHYVPEGSSTPRMVALGFGGTRLWIERQQDLMDDAPDAYSQMRRQNWSTTPQDGSAL